MFTNHNVHAEKFSCYGYLEQQGNQWYWYLEQQENSCYCIWSNKKTHALYLEQQESNKRATRQLEQQRNPCPSLRDQFFGNFGFEPYFLTELEEKK